MALTDDQLERSRQLANHYQPVPVRLNPNTDAVEIPGPAALILATETVVPPVGYRFLEAYAAKDASAVGTALLRQARNRGRQFVLLVITEERGHRYQAARDFAYVCDPARPLSDQQGELLRQMCIDEAMPNADRPRVRSFPAALELGYVSRTTDGLTTTEEGRAWIAGRFGIDWTEDVEVPDVGQRPLAL